MGDSTPFPSPAAIARAELFTRERFVYEGEELEEGLFPGTARRRALDAALAEIDGGAKQPSVEWRRNFSLLLGLERLLSEEEPHLADGPALSAHQVDALSGTLTALLADAQRTGDGQALDLYMLGAGASGPALKKRLVRVVEGVLYWLSRSTSRSNSKEYPPDQASWASMCSCAGLRKA